MQRSHRAVLVVAAVAAVISIGRIASAQTASASKFGGAYRQFLAENGADTVKIKAMPPRMPGAPGMTLADPEPGHTYDVFISTGTIPISFSRLVKGDDNNYHVGSQLGVGVGYLFMLGKMTPNTDGTVRIDPGLIFGPAGDIGVRNDGGDVKTTVSIGGILGFNIVALAAGYDFLGRSPYVGISSKLDFFALKKDAFITHWLHDPNPPKN